MAVVTDGSPDVVAEFDQAVTAAGGSAGDASFEINGDFYQGTFQVDPTHVRLTMNNNQNPGDIWVLNTATPTWITSGPVAPDSGLTT